MRHQKSLVAASSLPVPAGVRILMALVLCAMAGEGAALTVYRFGGTTGVDEPTAEEFGVPASSFEFRREPWSSYDDDDFGAVTLVDPDKDFLEPSILDSGENMTPLLEERGGSIRFHDGYGWKDDPSLDLLSDGDESTGFAGDTGITSNVATCSEFTEGGGGALTPLLGITDGRCRYFKFDLGGTFFVSHVRFAPTPRRLNSFFLKAFRIGANDANPLRDGKREMNLRWSFTKETFDWDVWVERLENSDPIVEIELPLEPVHDLIFEAPLGKWEIAEFEIFGTGAPPFAGYVSRVIDLGGPATLGGITWAGSQSEGNPAALTVRSGTTPDPNIYWRETFRGSERSKFTSAGGTLTRAAYFDLPRAQQAGITQDKQNWDVWAPEFPFDSGHTELGTTRPHQYVQMKVDFTAEPGRSGSRLDYVQLAVTQPPMATAVTGEVTPVAVRAGELTQFTYTIAPDTRTGSGFDIIEIRTPRKPRVVDVLVNDDAVSWERRREDDSGLEVRIPRVDDVNPARSIEILFETEIFRFGTEFAGSVADSERPFEVPQPVTPGNADDLIDSNSLNVALQSTRQQTIGALRLSSPVITPNGDGVTDEVLIEYDLINVAQHSAGAAVLEIYSLGGQRMAVLNRSRAISGRIPLTWNGTDGMGSVLPPGVYLLRLSVDADGNSETLIRVISVAY
jgi:hypothetical protein